MNHAKPIIILLLILWLIAFQVFPRVLGCALAIIGGLTLFLVYCAQEVYGERPMRLNPVLAG